MLNFHAEIQHIFVLHWLAIESLERYNHSV